MKKGKEDKRTPEESAEMFQRIIKASVKPLVKPTKEEQNKVKKDGSKHK